MRTISANIDAGREQGGIAGTLKRYVWSAAAAINFARLYVQPTQTTELPATIRLQPAW
jgi:magnesium-protoporphyrin IX monomethyl ester (oxidative) cyclase